MEAPLVGEASITIAKHIASISSPERLSLPTLAVKCDSMSTDMATSVISNNDTATFRLFKPTELLQAILLYVDMRDLLLSQRVAKQWRNTIAGSQKLQEALFFRQVDYWGGIHLGTEGVNTLLISNLDLGDKCGLRHWTRPNVSCTINCWYAGAHKGGDMYDLEASIDTNTGLQDSKQADYVRPSWLDMYLAQPQSALTARIYYQFKTRDGEMGAAREEDGIWGDEIRHWSITMENVCQMLVEAATKTSHDSGGPAPP